MGSRKERWALPPVLWGKPQTWEGVQTAVAEKHSIVRSSISRVGPQVEATGGRALGGPRVRPWMSG